MFTCAVLWSVSNKHRNHLGLLRGDSLGKKTPNLTLLFFCLPPHKSAHSACVQPDPPEGHGGSCELKPVAVNDILVLLSFWYSSAYQQLLLSGMLHLQVLARFKGTCSFKKTSCICYLLPSCSCGCDYWLLRCGPVPSTVCRDVSETKTEPF